MSRRARPIVAVSLALSSFAAACTGDGGDEITYEDLTSGTFVSIDDPDVVLVVDVDASTFALSVEGGDSVEGTFTALDEEEWTQCCYLNGTGHTKLETVALSPAAIELGPITLEAARLSADGPLLFDASDADDLESVSGYTFRSQ